MNVLNDKIIVRKLFFKLLPVQVLVIMSSYLSSIVNGLVIGNNLNALAMVALGFVGPLCMIVSALSSIVSIGLTILCGRYLGRGEKDKIDEVFSNSIIILIVIGIIVSLLTYFGSSTFASILGASGNSIPPTSTYIKGLSIGFLPTLILPCLLTYLQMCNKSNTSLLATILLAVFNFIFDIVMLNKFDLGIYGVGLATSISQLIIVIGVVIFFIKNKDLVNFKINSCKFEVIKKIILYGFPGALSSILYGIRNMFINKYAIIYGGELSVGALAIMSSACGIFDSFNIGVGNVIRMLGSVYIGERNIKLLKNLVKDGLMFGVIIGLIKILIIVITANPLGVLFGAEADVLTEFRSLFILYSYAMPINMIVVVFLALYQSLGKVLLCNILYFISCIVVPFICCFYVTRTVGVAAIYHSYYLTEIVTILFIVLVCIIYKKKFVTSLSDLILVDKDFEVKDSMFISINSINEVINISKEIQEYCLKKNMSSKISLISGLVIEEMAGNIVEHGFTKDNKKHSIEVFLYIENDEVNIKLRDDCIGFDPISRLKFDDKNDPSKNIGIKFVSKLAKEMNYQTTFGLNVLSIKL